VIYLKVSTKRKLRRPYSSQVAVPEIKETGQYQNDSSLDWETYGLTPQKGTTGAAGI